MDHSFIEALLGGEVHRADQLREKRALVQALECDLRVILTDYHD